MQLERKEGIRVCFYMALRSIFKRVRSSTATKKKAQKIPTISVKREEEQVKVRESEESSFFLLIFRLAQKKERRSTNVHAWKRRHSPQIMKIYDGTTSPGKVCSLVTETRITILKKMKNTFMLEISETPTVLFSLPQLKNVVAEGKKERKRVEKYFYCGDKQEGRLTSLKATSWTPKGPIYQRHPDLGG